ncbi:MAG: exostosin family protein [Patescibacteria group bacterium]
MDKLALYVNPAWRRGGGHLYTPLLFPFWGNPTTKASLFAKEMFDAHPFDTSYYGVTEKIEEADIVLAPYRHNWLLRHDPALLAECERTAKDAELPLLIDGMGDVETPIDKEDVYVLRIGGYRFIQEPGRIQIPPASDDLLERVCGGRLQVRTKSGATPVVGFAGWAWLSPLQRLRTYIKEAPLRVRGLFDSRYRAMQKGVLWRRRALNILKRSPLVSLNLKERGSFSGSSKTAEADLRALRQDLVDTVLASDYALDVRGDANDATRLFEILSLGRIPVVVDTERNFPFGDVVDYRDFCLIVDFRDIEKLSQIIADFHAQISPERFEAMQRAARDAFVNHFRIDAQTKHIVSMLRERIAKH